MTHLHDITGKNVLVAIDVSKARNDVLIQFPDGSRKKFKMANTARDFEKCVAYLKSLELPCLVGLEATGNYHRPLAYYLQTQGFPVRLVSSLAAARTREALYNSWDKNDPKDAQVILHMLKTGVTQTYCDPLIHGFHDLQEISKTYYQVSLHKVRVQHSLVTHFLPLYFPEAQKYLRSSRGEWVWRFLLTFPHPASVLKYPRDEFIKVSWDLVEAKVNKRAWLTDFYETASESIGLPVPEDSEGIRMFRLVIQEQLHLSRLRQQIEQHVGAHLRDHPDYGRLRTIPGIGPIHALTILAEAGDLRRFSHYKQFLKYCGFDLSTQQSGRFRGISKLSKRGNSRLCCTFWMAGLCAIRMRENTFREKFEKSIRADPTSGDLKRKAYTAVAAKLARVAYSLVKYGTDYRCLYEAAIPSGRIPSLRAVEASLTS